MDILAINIVIIIFFSSMIQSITGFGFAIVGTPLLLFFMEPRQVISLMTICGLILNLMVMIKTRGRSDPKVIWPLFAASLLGIVPGVYILKVIDPSILKLCIEILILLVAFFMATNYVPWAGDQLDSIYFSLFYTILWIKMLSSSYRKHSY